METVSSDIPPPLPPKPKSDPPPLAPRQQIPESLPMDDQPHATTPPPRPPKPLSASNATAAVPQRRKKGRQQVDTMSTVDCEPRQHDGFPGNGHLNYVQLQEKNAQLQKKNDGLKCILQKELCKNPEAYQQSHSSSSRRGRLPTV